MIQRLQAARDDESEAGEMRTLSAAGGDAPTIDANSPRYDGVAYAGGIMFPRGATLGVVLDLESLQIPDQCVVNTREHDAKLVVGNTTWIKNDGRRLLCSGLLTGTDETVLLTARRARRAGSRFPWQLSVDADYSTKNIEAVRPGQTVQINHRTITGPAYIVRQARLRRIDFVTKGGDAESQTSIAAAGGDSSIMTFEEWLASLGLDPATVTEEQRTKLQALYDKEYAGGDDSTENEAETEASMTASSGHKSTADGIEADTQALLAHRRRTLAAESSRIQSIHSICEQYGNPSFKVNGQQMTLEAHAIESGWTAQQTELQALRESRPKAPAGQVANLQASSDALVASQLMSAGFDLEQRLPRRLQIEAAAGQNPAPRFLFADINDDSKQMVLEAASRLQGLSSMDFARSAIELNGQRLPVGDRWVLEAAASSGSLSNVISTLANVSVLAKFEEAGDTTLEWCEEDLNGANFLTTKVVGMASPGGSLPRLKGGTAEHGHISDKGENITVYRFAEQLDVDEQTLINDQLGEVMRALTGPGGYAEKAANVRPDLVYALLLANAAMADGVAFFHATHRNLQTGSAFSSTTLGTAVGLMRKQYESGPDGKKSIRNIQPTHVIVPTPLEFSAKQSTTSAEVRSATGDNQGTLNPYQELKLKVVTDARLDLGLTHPVTDAALAGSASTWFTVSAKTPPVMVRYLRATGRSPQVRVTKLQQGRWGMNVDVALDIGAALTRFQSAVKSTG